MWPSSIWVQFADLSKVENENIEPADTPANRTIPFQARTVKTAQPAYYCLYIPKDVMLSDVRTTIANCFGLDINFQLRMVGRRKLDGSFGGSWAISHMGRLHAGDLFVRGDRAYLTACTRFPQKSSGYRALVASVIAGRG